jgi:hypothetical protein
MHMAIEWRPVYTSSIRAIGYDEGTGTTMILWQDGTKTAFEKVPQSTKILVNDVAAPIVQAISTNLTGKGPTSKAFR